MPKAVKSKYPKNPIMYSLIYSFINFAVVLFFNLFSYLTPLTKNSKFYLLTRISNKLINHLLFMTSALFFNNLHVKPSFRHKLRVKFLITDFLSLKKEVEKEYDGLILRNRSAERVSPLSVPLPLPKQAARGLVVKVVNTEPETFDNLEACSPCGIKLKIYAILKRFGLHRLDFLKEQSFVIRKPQGWGLELSHTTTTPTRCNLNLSIANPRILSSPYNLNVKYA